MLHTCVLCSTGFSSGFSSVPENQTGSPLQENIERAARPAMVRLSPGSSAEQANSQLTINTQRIAVCPSSPNQDSVFIKPPGEEMRLLSAAALTPSLHSYQATHIHRADSFLLVLPPGPNFASI